MDLWKKDQPSRSPENISVTMEITDLRNGPVDKLQKFLRSTAWSYKYNNKN